MSEVNRILRAAKDLISDPAHWAQRTDAMTAYGDSCLATDPQACRWCASGAVNRIGYLQDLGDWSVLRTAQKNLDYAARILSPTPCSFIGFNDSHTHVEVMQMFDLAIGVD